MKGTQQGDLSTGAAWRDTGEPRANIAARAEDPKGQGLGRGEEHSLTLVFQVAVAFAYPVREKPENTAPGGMSPHNVEGMFSPLAPASSPL